MDARDNMREILARIDELHALVENFDKRMFEKSLFGNILYTGASYSALLREALRLLQPASPAGKTLTSEDK